MTDQSPHGHVSARVELVAAVVLGAIAVATYLLQVVTFSRATTTTETALFNSLQFLLTVGFTWFSTRALSRREFEQSLKRFAISAYRRIADIDRLAGRLLSEVRDMTGEASPAERHRLKVIAAIVTDTGEIVRSSIADWGDVIGDELLTLEKIRRLEAQKGSIGDNETVARVRAEYETTLRGINEELATLRASLPARLQLLESAEPLDKVTHAAEWLRQQHRRDGGLRLTIGIFDSERPIETVGDDEKLNIRISAGGTLEVVDSTGAIVGLVRNDSPLEYSTFVKALETCYGSTSVPVTKVRGAKLVKEGTIPTLAAVVVAEPLAMRSTVHVPLTGESARTTT